MFNFIVKFSLNNRLIVLACALGLFIFGTVQALKLPIEVIPDISRPRVTIMTECPGMAPEEIETQVTTPLETYLNGATGVKTIRSNSTAGLSVCQVEFDWSVQPLTCRQIVDERIQLAAESLPEGVTPRMTPVTSMLAQLMFLTVWDEEDELNSMDLRTIADWTIRKQLLEIPGISEILVIGGDVKQFQVQARPEEMKKYGVTLEEIEEALEQSSQNVTGGFLTRQGPDQILVRSLGRIDEPTDEKKLEALKKLVVDPEAQPPVCLEQVAKVSCEPAVKVGSAGAYVRREDGSVYSGHAVVLTIEKQLNADTRRLSSAILEKSKQIEKTLRTTHPGVRIEPLYQQQTFINLAFHNVLESLWVGALLVFIVLVLFLMNIRVTLITILAMPLSVLIACLIFAWFGLTINTMTLGGLAVGIGELVDDAIVDVENIFRRLRENFRLPEGQRKTAISVVFHASVEIRNSIVYGTMIVVLVFFPIFFLPGMEGRLFSPLGLAYVVSLLSSLVVSLTLTPVLAYFLLPAKARKSSTHRDGLVLRLVQWLAGCAIRVSLAFPKAILTFAFMAILVAGWIFLGMERDFVPPFNEGAPQVNVTLAPGKSLETSEKYGDAIAAKLFQIDGVLSVVRKTGRAELDEHAVPINQSEMLCTLDLNSKRSIHEIFNDIDRIIAPSETPGAVSFYDQPLQHAISHMRTGSSSTIAIKVRGSDMRVLRQRSAEIQRLISKVQGIGTVRINPVQIDIPQLQITLDRDALAVYGLTPEKVNRTIEIAMQGVETVQILDGERKFDVLLRLEDDCREDLDALRQLPIQIPSGGTIPLYEIAEIHDAKGPSSITHEACRAQITVQASPRNRGAVDVKNDIDAVLEPHWAELTAGDVSIELTGLFQSEQESTRRLLFLSLFSLVAIFLVLYRMFHSANISLQIMASLPLALVGAVAAMVLTGQDRSVPNLVGMISLCGIASRNGILLIDHYFHLMRFEGMKFSKELLIHAGKDRVAPVLMTALTSVLGLIPLTLSPDTPGREILYPIATVVVGGLVTSTLMEFFVRPALFWLCAQHSVRKLMEEGVAESERID
ncbi:MAG: efflux RND transporter permease subunit [Thermoguttaceae bacterium]|nr:efflux RND transporter permease subunit [Thermoguttaceae bacterium]